MKVKKLILILMLILGVVPTRGSAEFLVGEVVAVNRDRQEFVIVSIFTDKGETESSGKESRIKVKAVGEVLSQYEKSIPLLPGCVQVGERVRVWGEIPATGAVFLAIDVRGCGGMGCNDPTGVRSRLQKYKKSNSLNPETELDVVPSPVSGEVNSNDNDGGSRTGRGRGNGRGNGGSGGGRGR
jgi:uncharacterized membrane protein YgcG